MTVHHCRVARTDDVLVVQNSELSLELPHRVNGACRAGEHEAGADVLIVNATQANPDVVTTERVVDLILHLVVDRGDFDNVLVRHQQEGVALTHVARLDLANDDRARVLVFLGDGYHQRCSYLAVDHWHFVEVLEQRGATVHMTGQ